MDNASKALIMAGAILISLGIVGLAVYVFSIARDVQTGARERLTTAEITSLNSDLSAFAGNKVGGYQIISFLERVDVLNAREIFPTKIIAGDGSSIPKDNIRGSAYYKLELKDTDNDGFYDVYIISNSPVSTNNG